IRKIKLNTNLWVILKIKNQNPKKFLILLLLLLLMVLHYKIFYVFSDKIILLVKFLLNLVLFKVNLLINLLLILFIISIDWMSILWLSQEVEVHLKIYFLFHQKMLLKHSIILKNIPSLL